MGGEMLPIEDATTLAAYVSAGTPYTAGAVAVDSVSAISHYAGGRPFTDTARLCVAFDEPVAYVNVGIPYTSAGRICVSLDPPTYVGMGVAFAANGSISVSSNPTGFKAGFGYSNINISTIDDTAQTFTVDNLNTSGSGSFEAALTASITGADKVIVFNVGGNIKINKLVTAVGAGAPFGIYILGYTAPSPVNIERGEVRTGNSITKVFIEGIRLRQGDLDENDDIRPPLGADNIDGLGIAGNATTDVVLINISSAYSLDEAVRIRRSGGTKITNVSILNSIFAAPLHNSIHPINPHSYGALITDTDNITMAGNIHTQFTRRAPRIDEGNLENVNNVYYNAGVFIIHLQSGSGVSNVDSIGNMVLFPSDINNQYSVQNPSSPLRAVVRNRNDGASVTNVYTDDNLISDNSVGPIPEALGTDGGNAPVISSVRLNTASGLTPLPSSQTLSRAIANAGAWPDQRDTVDQRAIDQITNLTGTYVDSQSEFITVDEPLGYPVVTTSSFRNLDIPATGLAEFFATFPRSDPPTIPSTVPTAPQNLVATAGILQNVLTCDAPASDGNTAVMSYTFESSVGGGAYSTIYTGEDLTFTHTGLTKNIEYSYRVSATNAVGVSAASNIDSATPEGLTISVEAFDFVGSGTDASTYTFPAVAVGDGDLYLMVGSRSGDLGVTVSVTGATAVGTQTNRGSDFKSPIAAFVISGVTAGTRSVEVTFSAPVSRCLVACYTLSNADFSAATQISANSGANGIAVTEKGMLLGVATGASTSYTWTGLTERQPWTNSGDGFGMAAADEPILVDGIIAVDVVGGTSSGGYLIQHIPSF